MTKHLFAYTTLATTILITALATPSMATTTVYKNGDTEIGVGGRLQLMGFAEQLQSDPFRSAGRLYMFEKQSRLMFSAQQGAYGFFSQLALGGEDVYTNNVNLTLLDMYATGPLLGLAQWRAGQFRVPYGRELMTNGGNLAFNDRSITAPYFLMGRDVGASLNAQVGPANVVGGVFLGGGRDVPQRYLPEVLGIPLVALRATIGDNDADAYNLSQHDNLDTAKTRQSFAANALFTRDSLVGHSTVLNVKNPFDKSLLLSPNYNPYIGMKNAEGHMAQGQLWQAGLDYAVKTPFAGGTASGEAEVNYGNFSNLYGGLNVAGGRVQAAYYAKPYQVALRYAILAPDSKFAVTNTTAGSPNVGKTTAIFPDATPIQELTPGFTYFLNGDNLKLTVDLPILFNAPVVTENGLGNYNLVNQNDQTPLLTNAANSISRQFVVQLRAGLQYQF